ncbi:universal stress protein [Chloroflexota bacterium]
MYQNILVPLDGSELAECTLPHVESIAKGCQVNNVTLIQVVEPASWESLAMPIPASITLHNTPPTNAGLAEGLERMELESKAQAEGYLQRVAGRLAYDGEVKIEVMVGKVVESITEYASSINADLIIIATHGRSGASRWIWGSVADRILRSACVPVLMVRGPGCVVGI